MDDLVDEFEEFRTYGARYWAWVWHDPGGHLSLPNFFDVDRSIRGSPYTSYPYLAQENISRGIMDIIVPYYYY